MTKRTSEEVILFVLSAIAVIGLLPFAVVRFNLGAWADVIAAFFLSVLGCILFAYAFANQRNRQRDLLMQLSTEDPLTGAGNRRALHKKLGQLVASHRRTAEPMCAILLDLDNFEIINDKKGHATGDEVLRNVADTITARIRLTDGLYRSGGDEFVVLATSATGVTAITLAEEIRELIAAVLAKLELPGSVGSRRIS